MITDVPMEWDVTTESSTVNTEEVKTDEAKDSKTVPYDRFSQKVKENSVLRENMNSLRNEIKEIKSLLKGNQKPDYDNMTPAELEKSIRENILNEQKLAQLEEAQKVQEAEQFIDDFFDWLKDEWHKFDANEIMKLALEEFDNDLPKAWKAYQREQKAISELEAEKAKQKAKDWESISGKKWEEVKSPKKWVGSWNDVYESGFKYIK